MAQRRPKKVKHHKRIHTKHRRSTKRKVLTTVLVVSICAVCAFVGYNVMGVYKKYQEGLIKPPKPPSQSISESSVEKPKPEPSTPESKPDPEPEPQKENKELATAFITYDEMRDDALLSKKLEEYKNAGYNAVAFELKDKQGRLKYKTEFGPAKDIEASLPDGFNLKEKVEKIRAAGMEPVGIISCFKDDWASQKLKKAYIMFRGDHEFRWIDNDRNNGGASWLNPESEVATSYLKGIISEVLELGVKEVVLDDFQYPDGYSVEQSYAGEKSEASKINVLKELAATIQKGADERKAKVYMLTDETSAMDKNDKLYGGNPLDIGFSGYVVSVYMKEVPKSVKVGEETIEAGENQEKEATKKVIEFVKNKYSEKDVVIMVPKDRPKQKEALDETETKEYIQR